MVLYENYVQGRHVLYWMNIRYTKFRKHTDKHESYTRQCNEQLIDFQKYLQTHCFAFDYLLQRIRKIFSHEQWCATLFHCVDLQEYSSSFAQNPYLLLKMPICHHFMTFMRLKKVIHRLRRPKCKAILIHLTILWHS